MKKGLKAYLSSVIRVSYISRSSLTNILKLFNTYGFCRYNTILSSFKIHSPLRYGVLLSVILSFFLLSFINLKGTIIFSLLIVFLYNYISEINFSKSIFSFKYPLLAIICQLSWLLGVFRGMINYNNAKSKNSNFIKWKG